ncbi:MULTISPECIES: hypothetical protein [Myxococcus]|uniref:Lipoprotein n=1 Tax=Myxococcus llanfairpwllgwyngyllgogerychwyrndrobwllllantysiliogogogochensis TaxID=2590453 RepID=A0A540WP44_9BACT|nr:MULTISPECIES: hypothetical protein [Myxococcus]NTX08296.1 hypothetical protein [Myxococcus sp. CA040A]NTX14751.1 hypothetical protein [Myxococcus sp. CA056]TQF10779.1 hypothetical protein FJV41_37700 [Myxococcus llanfairpwllgwyngyllgogerychwyrndrobwllllantysiliogogogochensis]
MNSLGRLAVVCGLLTLIGCGPEAPVPEASEEATTSQTAVPVGHPICPEVMPPLCEDGDLYPIYSGKCLIGFNCVPHVVANAICPNPVYPAPGFCEDGIITPVYVGGCIVRYTCTR